MNCPDCGAPLQLQDGRESAVCDYCRAIYRPDADDDGLRVFDQTAALVCPVCREPLHHATVDRQRILYCTACRGMLIAMAAFVAALDSTRAQRRGSGRIAPPPDPRELERRLQCPQCGHAMDTHYYAGGGNVVIDDCSRCELNWLDAGEFAAIASAPDHSVDEPASSE